MFTLSEFKYTDTILGKGSFGVVKKAIHRETRQIYALKTIPHSRIKQSELEIHQELDHPNILKLHTSFEDSANIYLVMEYAEKGSLFQNIHDSSLSEEESWNFFLQICCGIRYLHSRGLMHRDLKPENILIGADNIIKISDFGWSARSDGLRQSICGTVDFMAPEILHRTGHSYEVDLWALGALLYELRHGYAPFQQYTGPEKAQNICDGNFTISKHLTTEEKDLISKLLTVPRDERITLDEVFEHPWVNKFSHNVHIDRIHLHRKTRGKINWINGTLCEIEFENRHPVQVCSHLAHHLLKVKNSTDYDSTEVLKFYKKKKNKRKIKELSTNSTFPSLSPKQNNDLLAKELDEINIIKALVQNSENQDNLHKRIKKPRFNLWSTIFGCGCR